MMRGQLAVAGLLLCVFAAVPAGTQTRQGAVDWIFLVDTSGSMLANGVFDDVKGSLDTFIREASPGDTVTLFTFARDVRMQTSTPVGEKRDDLFAIVQGLEAKGKRTHLGAAIAQGLDRAERNRDTTRAQAIVLFTDGKEDVDGIRNPVPIASNVERAQRIKPFIFFVSLKEHEPQLQQFNGAEFVEATNAAAIGEVAAGIRRTIEQPLKEPDNPPPPPPPPPPPINPEVRKQPSLLPWLIGVALLIAAALIARAVQKQRNQLEGEIEIVAPRVPDAYHGLTPLKKTEVVLSRFVPGDLLDGSDARLFCRHKAGRKQVWIAAEGGSLRVNDIEVPLTELYDADTIQVGKARLRFNRAGYERPEENLS
ncbi:MAG TPA: vWA domain-containing protein [Thermoanaerobaculia bacterium]